MGNVHSGGCLCGKVRFEITGRFDRFMLCHCSRCRKHSGTAHASNLFAKEAALRWLSGEDNITKFAVEGTRFSRSFCRDCGSTLPERRSDESLMVPAGSLETDVDIAPQARIFWGSRANWDNGLERVQAFDSLPTKER